MVLLSLLVIKFFIFSKVVPMIFFDFSTFFSKSSRFLSAFFARISFFSRAAFFLRSMISALRFAAASSLSSMLAILCVVDGFLNFSTSAALIGASGFLAFTELAVLLIMLCKKLVLSWIRMLYDNF